MYTLIRLRDGCTREAVVVAHTKSQIRLAVAGAADALDLRLSGTHWLDESDAPVQFDFLLDDVQSAFAAPRAMRAAACAG